MTDDLTALTRAGYDAVAEDYAALLPDLGAETALDIAMIDDFADRCLRAGSDPVADVGCGTGRVTTHLASRGLAVAGYDLSPGMVAVARRTHPALRFEVAAMQELPLADAALGGVLAWYALIHTAPADLLPVAAELRRVLRPGGHLLTAFHAGDGEVVHRPTAYGRDVPLTSVRHDPDHVAGVLVTAGLDVVARLDRAAEGREQTPQTVLLARTATTA